MFTRKIRSDHRRRAVVGVLVAVCMIVLVGFASFSIDMGYIYVSHGEMQAAVDAAALAGVSAPPESQSLAVARATEVSGANVVAGHPVVAGTLQVEVGYWEARTSSFSLPIGDELAAPNAVHVIGGRTEIPTFFAGVFGVNHTDVWRAATANHGGGRCAGIWGLNGLDGDGSLVTDSYDSSVGVYGPGNIYFNGDVCSDRNIVLEGGVTIGGDVMYGQGHDLTISGSSYSIYGVTAEHNRSVEIPSFDMAEAAANNDNGTIGLTKRNRDPFDGSPWNLYVTGNDNLTLAGGTYYFTSALVDGRATLTVTEPTVLYISGSATFTGGGVVNTSNDPKNLIIYSTGANLTIDGSAGFYGSIIAPATTVTFTGGSSIFGTILAGYMELFGDTQIHVDSEAVRQWFGVGPEAPVLVE